jgi:hypothetical protein
MDLEFVHIGSYISASHFRCKNGLWHAKESGSKCSYAGQFKSTAGHYAIPGTRDFDRYPSDVKPGLNMLEELNNSYV